MREKLKKLMEKEGFILILFLCVCVVAGGTLLLSLKNINTAKKKLGNENFVIVDSYPERDSMLNYLDFDLDDLPNFQVNKDGLMDLALEEEASDEEVLEAAVTEEEFSELDIEDLEFEEDEDMEDIQVVESYTTLSFPVDGAIITDYTTDTLIYSETLEAWVGHGALDIRADEGSTVKAAGDGVVKEVYDDQLWGIVIVIDHGDELLTRYSNLSTKDMVKEGLQVKKGDHISKVGKTAKVEMLMEPHIHFEVIKKGKLVNPRSIIK